MGQAVRALGDHAAYVEALAISVDPPRDTPAEIDAFLQRYRAKGALRYLNGSVAELRPVWKAFAGRRRLRHGGPEHVLRSGARLRSHRNVAFDAHPGVDLTAASLRTTSGSQRVTFRGSKSG